MSYSIHKIAFPMKRKKCKTALFEDFDVRKQHKMSMSEELLWTHIFEGWLKVKTTPIKGLFLSNRHDLASQAIIIDGLEWCELLVDYFILVSAV